MTPTPKNTSAFFDHIYSLHALKLKSLHGTEKGLGWIITWGLPFLVFLLVLMSTLGPAFSISLLARPDRKRSKPSLPNVAGRMIMTMIPPHVRGHQPLHPDAQVAILARPKNEMKMIRHEAVRQQPHRQALGRLAE